MKRKIHPFNAEAIKKSGKIFSAGGIVCFPTETVYALAADATNDKAIKRVYTVKQRDPLKPLSLLMRDIEQIQNICILNDSARTLLHAYSPGPLTVVLELKKNSNISSMVTHGDTIGVRIPHHENALKLLNALPFPLVGTSANLSGCGDTISADDVMKTLGDKVDYILHDTNTAADGMASTVVDLTSDEPVILRQGSITEENIRQALRLNQ